MRIAVFTLVMLALVSCGRAPREDGLIVRKGSYASQSGKFTLTVAVTGNGIVNYSVADGADDAILFSHGGFSTYHRWSFYWDKNDQLWTQNSDIGPFAVWSRGSDGRWTMQPINKASPLLATIPKPVYDHLPHTLKKDLKIESGLPSAP